MSLTDEDKRWISEQLQALEDRLLTAIEDEPDEFHSIEIVEERGRQKKRRDQRLLNWVFQEPQITCLHSRIGDDGICFHCGKRAAIKLDNSTNHEES